MCDMTNRFGSKIRKLREAIGISQTELEKRIGHEGRGYVYDIKRGAFIPSEEKLKKIARALGSPLLCSRTCSLSPGLKRWASRTGSS
jgi:transcriptional regulator with XRE-family HTH domain